MNKKTLSINQYIFYVSLVLTSVAKSLPHAILTVLLLSKGVTVTDIIWIQSVYSLAMLIFEIPSGVWADIYSRKLLYLLSNILLVIFFALVFVAHQFIILVIAWFIYGFSQALSSGTLDAQLINDLKSLNAQSSIDKFIKYSNQLGFVSLIIGSLLGAYLYFKIGVNIYIIAGVLTMVSVINILLFNNQSQVKELAKQTVVSHIKSSWYELKNTDTLKFVFVLSVINQIFFQTHYQLWQALFIFKHMNEKYFSILYIVFQIMSMTALFLAKYFLNNWVTC